MVLLHSKQSVPISTNDPVTLTFQTAGTAPTLIQISGYEVEFESSILDIKGRILNQARLPYIRTGPVYQLLGAGEASGQIKVRVSAIHQTNNATVSIEVYQLPQNGRSGRLAQQAYRLYSNSIQSTDSEAAKLWRHRVHELRQATSLFKKAGQQEQALWSGFLAAYFTYFPVSEFQSASDLAHAVQVQAREADLPKLELMAMQLEGQAIIERDDSGSSVLAAANLKKAQRLFRQSAKRAEQQGMRFEQAWAINNLGIAYYYQESLDKALQQYRQVLPIALELQDAYMVNLARANIAMVNEKLGNYEAALEALLAIREEWTQRDLLAERVHNLADIGRLYSKLFLFSKAIDALSEAMALARRLDSKESVGRIGLSLAMAYNDMGQRHRAQDMLLTAIADMKDAHYGRGLRNAYQLLADMHRFDGAHDQVRLSREQQRQYLRSDREHADFLFSQGLDALATDDLVDADKLFTASHAAAIKIEDTSLQVRSLLQHCALVPNSAPDDVACDSRRLEDMLNDWLPRATPRYALDARFSWAQLIAGQGEDQRALEVLEDLVEDIQLYRSRLSGVLGAWYWESREKVFSTYMDLLLKDIQTPLQVVDALVALDRFRNLENSSRRRESIDGFALLPALETDKVRGMVARMAGSMEESARQDLGREIDRILLAAGNNAGYQRVDVENILSGLDSLAPDAAYLTYYFSKSDAWAWIAGPQGVRLVQLGAAKPVLDLLETAREGLRVVGNDSLIQDLDALGAMLLQPLGTSLPVTIYLGPVGALAGFPFEAVRHNNRFLAQDHAVINLLSLGGIHELSKSDWRVEKWNSILLAGSPKKMDSDFVELPGTVSEIENIAHLFKQRQVHKVAGADLQRTSFSGPVFSSADLIHIASHGSINLNYPELSRLNLSEQYDDDFDYLTPLDISENPVQASLVVLSACETTGLNDFAYDSNLGFVSEFLQAGAGTVIASLWPVPDRYTSDFMSDFYSALLKGVDIPVALVLTKRKRINAARDKGILAPGIQNWAAFQIHAE